MKFVFHNGTFIKKIGQIPFSPSEKSPLASFHYYIVSLLPPLLDRCLDAPSAIILVKLHSPLYEGFEIFQENMALIIFIKVFKSFQTLIVFKQRNRGKSMYDTWFEYVTFQHRYLNILFLHNYKKMYLFHTEKIWLKGSLTNLFC